MPRPTRSISILLLSRLLATVVLAVPLASATSSNEARSVQQRDIFSDIGNFFDGLEMQVNMDIFQPVANFFTTVAGDINQYVVMPAEQFFMQANTVVLSGLYDINMFTADIGKAIESAVIDEAMTVENFAVQVGKEITSDTNTVINNVKTEFDNVITPALKSAGTDIGNAFNEAGSDILAGLTVAGNYIEKHPELIGEILLTAVLIGVTFVQPELVAADGALIGEIAVEAGAETAATVATEIGADAAAEGVADVVVDEAASEVISAADEPIYANVQELLAQAPQDEPIYANIQELLDSAASSSSSSSSSSSAALQIDTFPEISQQTADELTSLSQSFGDAAESPYANIPELLQQLQAAGRIVARDFVPKVEARNAGLEERKAKTTSTTTKAATHPVTTTTKSTTHAPTATAKPATSSTPAKGSGVTIPQAKLKAWMTHHYLTRTTSSKKNTKGLLKASLKTMLTGMTATDLKPQIPISLTKIPQAAGVTYPPTPAAHRNAISHQIATGNATAYNSHNVKVKIEMNPNAPVDVCLGVPKTNCQFGNQAGKPYCLHQCATRWYNQMNVNPVHY